MPLLEPLTIAPPMFPHRVWVQLQDTAGITRLFTISASDVVVVVGPVYQADQATAGIATGSYTVESVSSDSLPVATAISDGDQVFLLTAGMADEAYLPPGNGSHSLWLAPNVGAEDGWVQISIDRAPPGRR